MTQLNHVTKNNTCIFNDGVHTIVKYHHTDVVKFNHQEIVLNSNGWQTYTTKVRMNQTANQFGLDYYVYQNDFTWYVRAGGFNIEFYDGMKLIRQLDYTWINSTISEYTLKLNDIVQSIESDINDAIIQSLCFEFWNTHNDNERQYIYDDIFDRMNDISPIGCWYGGHPDDPTMVGFWNIE